MIIVVLQPAHALCTATIGKSTYHPGENAVVTMKCNADYYNMGSRKDTFYDTFLVTEGSDSITEYGGGIATEETEKTLIDTIKEKTDTYRKSIYIGLLIITVVTIFCFMVYKKREE